MKLLALDSSGLVASVAYMIDDKMVGEFTTNFKKTHSQTLLPMLDEVTKMIDMDLEDVDAIVVSKGPGSFTGLRIGAATAKGLGLALNKPIVAVPTVDAIAYNLYGTEGLICPLMDARRNQVYTGLYTFEAGEFKVIDEEKAVSLDDIIGELNQIGQHVIFLGDGVPVYKTQIEEKLTVTHSYAPAHLAYQRAGALAALGAIYYEKGMIETAAQHQPEYLRLSQAERELAEKQKKGQ